MNARVRARCPSVAMPPIRTSQTSMPQLGHDQTNSAGTSDIGVRNSTMYVTMTAGDSVRDSALT